MSFLDFGASKPSGQQQPEKRIKTYMLTPAGKLKLKNLGGNEPEFAVMATILQNTPATMDEIAEGAHLQRDKAKFTVGTLISKEWVMVAGSRAEA